MVAMLFILGLPGSGKSAVFRHVTDYVLQRYGCKTRRFNDYEILQKMFDYDTDKQFKPADDGGFDVLDLNAFDIALKRLEQVVIEYLDAAKKDEIIIIEFSRNDYRRAFSLFRKPFLQGAYFLHLDAEVNICQQRIRERVAHPKYPEDDYPVSDYIFETYYNGDDGRYLANTLAEEPGIDKERVLTIENTSSLEEVITEITPFINHMLNSTKTTTTEPLILQSNEQFSWEELLVEMI